METLQGEITGF